VKKTFFILMCLLIVAGMSFASGKTFNLAFVIPGTDSQYWNQYCGTGVHNAAIDASKKLGINVDVKMYGPTQEGNTTSYMDILQSVIAKHPDAIVTATMDPDGTAHIVKEAHDQGIFLNLFSLGITGNEEDYGSLYYCDQPQQGTIAADAFVALLKEKGLPMKGIVGVHMATLVPILVQKLNNFSKRMHELAPDITVLPTVYNQNDVNKAEANVENQIATYSNKLVGFFGGNNLSGDGISLAVGKAGLGSKLVDVAVDSDDLEIKALREGNLDAIIAQTPYAQGYGAAWNVIAHVYSGAPLDPKMVNLPAKVVTKANMDTPEFAALLNPLLLAEKPQ
jgi:ribose transport system substrate-binding protein